MICDYGCGMKATHKFKNGKWCCSDNVSKCPEIKHDISEKQKGENNYWYGKTLSSERRKQLSESGKGRIPWNKNVKNCYSEESLAKMVRKNFTHSEETKMKIGEGNKNKVRSPEFKQFLREGAMGNKRHLRSIEQWKEIYPMFAKIEEMRYEPGKKGAIQVHCKNHKCKNSKEHGGWFTPSKRQFQDRIYSIENGPNAAYYCSDECKEECPLYGKTVNQIIKEDQIKSGNIDASWYTSKEYQEWRLTVLERDKYTCQWCDGPANIAHHILPQKPYPHFSLDPENGVASCDDCHFKYGHRDSWCNNSYLEKLICK